MSFPPPSLVDTLPIVYLFSRNGGPKAVGDLRDSLVKHNAAAMQKRAIEPSLLILGELVRLHPDDKRLLAVMHACTAVDQSIDPCSGNPMECTRVATRMMYDGSVRVKTTKPLL